MANLWTTLAAALALGSGVPGPVLPAQTPPPSTPSVRVPYLSQPIVLDGVLDEWGGVPGLELNRAQQVTNTIGTPAWRGTDDLSATLYLAYDEAHLYVAARILDDEFVREREGGDVSHWHQGDAVEIFLDLDLEDDRTGDRSSKIPFDQDDLQIFLMPLNPVRSWGLITHEAGQDKRGGSALTGVQVAHREQKGRGYTLEAVIPFHNLLGVGFERGVRQIGFNAAIDDCDGESRYLYMTWTGTNPVSPQDTRQFAALEFAGPRAPLEPGPQPGADWYEQLRELGPYLLWPVLILLLGALCLRAWGWISSRHATLRLAGQLLGVALLVLGLFLPGWLTQLRAFGTQSELENVVESLQAQLPELEQGTLGSYRGGERDRPFVDLLSGRTVPRVQTVTHAQLVDLAAAGFGTGPRRFPDLEAFPLQPYWIPLPADHTEQFSFDSPLEGSYLNVVVAMPTFRGVNPTAAVRIARQFEDGRDPVVDEFLLDRQLYTSCEALGHPDSEMAVAQIELDGGLQSISLTAQGAEDVSLVALTVIPGRDEEGVPLSLGQASLGGVETELRGGYPEETGIRLAPGEVARVALDPAKAESFEALWLFYQAEYPGSDIPLPFRDEKVCEVVLHFAGGAPEPKTIEFHHQESMFFELASNNPDAEPTDPRASVAYRWEDDDGEVHLTLGYEEELPGGAVVESIEFRNFADKYPVHFRSAVFRDSKPTVRVEPGDSPLELTESRQEVRLKERALEDVHGASVAIYRSGGLVETTLPGAPMSLPRGLERQLSPEAVQSRVVISGDARVYEAYFPLQGEGWSGAVLGVFLPDAGHGGYARLVNQIGVLLCLLAAPVLLLLFGEVLAVLNNLRIRLMAVLTVAAVVPLAILSVVLVQVLESGHESRLTGSMQQAIAAASGRLDEQQRELRAAARTWLDSLAQEIVDGGAAALSKPQSRTELVAGLEATMASQKPPEWAGGFLRLELSGQDTGLGLTAFVGDSALRTAETPLRRDPSIYLSWGIPFLGVRWEREIEGLGLCSLSIGRPLDQGLLGGLSPGKGVLLCDTKGYPLTAVDGAAFVDTSLRGSATEPRLMIERRQALTDVLDGGQPVVARHAAPGGGWIAVYDVLRDLEDTPRALLGVLDADQDAALPLALGAVPVRTFFLTVGGLILLMAGFLSFVVTSRISKPIERLERGAQALSRGEFDVRVETEEGGQIGRLTRTFNRMARDLHGRMQDLHDLNRGIQDLTSRLDLDQTVTSAIGFCARHSSADQVRVLLRDPERARVAVYGGTTEQLDGEAPDVTALLAASGPMSMPMRAASDESGRALPRCFPQCASLVALPLVMAGRTRGAILLLFESARPAEVQLELLTALAAQTAAAIENARLYLHAVEDPDTGAYVPDYFRRTVAQAVQEAGEVDRPLALLGVELVDVERLREELGTERFSELMERVAQQLRRSLPKSTVLCRSSTSSLQCLLLGTDGEAARQVEAEVRTQLENAELELPSGQAGLRVLTSVAAFPEEAASAEFLFDALGHQRSPAGAPPLEERMRELDAEGVPVQSPAMRSLFRTLERVAPTNLTVLLEGETGTGKEILTNLIHRWSKRADGPLVKVHCAALSESLLQSELFGHEKGAFTGAVSRKIGRFEQAEGGTVFLDEIGEISLDTQVKLLRVLQEREIDRVGGVQPVPVDVRVVAATNRNMRDMVADGSFREDLYYRLQGMVVTVPPLRDRKRDIPALVEQFRSEAEAAGQTRIQRFHPDAMDELFRRDWPGNIRELRNAVFRAMVLATGEEVRLEDLHGVLPPAQPAPPEAFEALSAAGVEPVVAIPQPPPGSAIGPEEPIEGRLAALLRLIEQRGSITTQEYVTEAGISNRTGLRDLTQLVELGWVERIGKRRGARYRRGRTGSWS